MKKIALGVIIVTVMMMFVGCNRVISHKQIDAPSHTDDLENGANQLEPSNNPSGYSKTYNDESQKEIQYDKLSFNIGSYHVVSYTRNDDIDTFKCEIDKGEGYSWSKTHMTITVRAIEKQDFLDTESMVAYLCDMYPNYEKIKVLNNVTDKSGILSLYIVSEGDQTKYVVCYKQACYLIESDVDEIYLFENFPSAYYELHNQKIECADANVTTVHETISYNKYEFDKVEYEIIRGKDGTTYSAELYWDKEYQYHFTLKNEKGDTLLKLTTHASSLFNVISLLDANRDGYADIQFLEEEGTLNSSYALYVWDDITKSFIKVKCDEMLSYFEVHDGYLLNWLKDDGQSGVIQKLVWKNSNTLIKESEEAY